MASPGGGDQRMPLERGTVLTIGDRPTIASQHTGDIVAFAYRTVKRRASMERHHFQVGDVVQFRRYPPGPGGAAANGAKAEQVWLLSAVRDAPPARVHQAEPVQAQPCHAAAGFDGADAAAQAAIPSSADPSITMPAGTLWRHDPYSVDCCATAVLPRSAR
eukprot:TRINITY_DN3471_c0_g1_i1.p1 TRINITY_DN3471_c0_g1~~TRINITY_DN3471_c0_g1_i1.p1  ORF type:complete len:189 (+),score=20.58 TRINITY_DN3471_c0_g1_i1:85-567(+)